MFVISLCVSVINNHGFDDTIGQNDFGVEKTTGVFDGFSAESIGSPPPHNDQAMILYNGTCFVIIV